MDESVYDRYFTGKKSSGNARVSRTAAVSDEVHIDIWKYLSEDGENLIVPYFIHPDLGWCDNSFRFYVDIYTFPNRQ